MSKTDNCVIVYQDTDSVAQILQRLKICHFIEC